MTLQQRDKRALLLLGVAAVVAAVVQFWPAGNGGAKIIAPPDEVAAAEKRLERMRQLAATVPGKEEVLKKVAAELAAREKGLIQADTAAQAQAQLLQILRRVGKAQPQPVDVRGNEMGPVRSFGDAYGEVTVTVSMDCRIEQLVNLLADITAQPELIATHEIRIGAAQGREKVVPVRLTVSGLVPKKLVPQKKGANAF
jgi:hypothetical protein